MIAATRPAWASEVTSLYPGQAGDQVADEREPTGTVLSRGDLRTDDLAVPVGIHASGDKGMDRHDPATLTHLQHQRVSGHEENRPRRRADACELFHVGVEVHAICETCDSTGW